MNDWMRVSFIAIWCTIKYMCSVSTHHGFRLVLNITTLLAWYGTVWYGWTSHWRRFFLISTRHIERIRGVFFATMCYINWHLHYIPIDTLQVILGTILWIVWANQQRRSTEGRWLVKQVDGRSQHAQLNVMKQEVKVIWQKAPHGVPIPRLGVTPGGRKLYHWIPGVGFPISVP